MTEWVLIMTLSAFAYDGGSAMHTASMSTHEACLLAGEAWKRSINARNVHNPSYVCVWTGLKQTEGKKYTFPKLIKGE